MRNTRPVLSVALPLAVILGIAIALLLRSHGRLGASPSAGGAAGGSAQATAGGPGGSGAGEGPSGAAAGRKGRKAGPVAGEDNAEDAGEPTTIFELPLEKGRVLVGRVVDAAGQGQAGWAVSMRAVGAGVSQMPGSGLADADGWFTLRSEVSGAVQFALSLYPQRRPDAYESYQFESGEIDLPRGGQAEPLTLTVDIGHTVKGRVVLRGSGVPVPGVEVQVKVNEEDAASWADGPQCSLLSAELCAREKTGGNGAFTIENVPNGSLNFTLEAKEIVRKSEKGGELQGEAVFDVGDLAVGQARSIAGRLVDATTRDPNRPTYPFHGVTVDATNDFGEGVERGRGDPYDFGEGASGNDVYPDEQGRFTAEGIGDGVTRVTFTAPGYLPLVMRDVTLRPASQTDLGDILLQPGCTLSGILIDKALGKPVRRDEYFNITVEEAGKAHSRNNGLAKVAGDDGKFEIHGVSREAETVTLTVPGFPARTVTTIPAPDDQGCIDLGRIELERGGQIEGIVVDPQDAPRPGAATVILTQKDGDLQKDDRDSDSDSDEGDGKTVQHYSYADREGKFRASALPPGTYKVIANAEGCAPSTVGNIEVTGSGDPTPVRVVVGAGARLKGTLVDLGTRILSGWQALLDQEGGSVSYEGGGAAAQTGALGNFELTRLPAGDVRVLFAFSQNAKNVRTSMTFLSAPVAPTDREVVFILPLSPMLQGRLVDEEGRGVAGARVHVAQGHGSANGNSGSAGQQETGCSLRKLDLTAESATDDSGRFRVGPVAVGTAGIEFSGDMLVKKTLDGTVIGVDDEYDLGDVTVQAGHVLVGRLVDNATGAPVQLSGDAPVGGHARRPAGDATVSVRAKELDSTFRVTGVPGDATSVVLNVQHYLPCEVTDLRVQPGQETDLGDLTLDPGVTLRVRLVDAGTGAPYSGADPGDGGTSVEAVGQKKSDGDNVGTWSASALPDVDRGVYLFRTAPAALQQITLTPAGCEPLAIDSVPSADSHGIADLGDRRVKRKAAGGTQ